MSLAPARLVEPLKVQLNRCHTFIARALPTHLTAGRQISMAINCFHKNPELQRCDLLSICACVIQAAELGLELAGPLGEAFLVPRRGECTLQVGYRGFYRLAFNSGRVLAFPQRTVAERDEFRVCYGSAQRLEHVPAAGDRGPAVGYYAVCTLRDGGHDFEYMTRHDAEQHRQRYAAWKSEKGPWWTHFDAMAMKSCVRALAKRLPLSPQLAAAAGVDECHEAGQGRTVWPELPPGVTATSGVEALLAGPEAPPDDPAEAAERAAIQGDS